MKTLTKKSEIIARVAKDLDLDKERVKTYIILFFSEHGVKKFITNFKRLVLTDFCFFFPSRYSIMINNEKLREKMKRFYRKKKKEKKARELLQNEN